MCVQAGKDTHTCAHTDVCVHTNGPRSAQEKKRSFGIRPRLLAQLSCSLYWTGQTQACPKTSTVRPALQSSRPCPHGQGPYQHMTQAPHRAMPSQNLLYK